MAQGLPASQECPWSCLTLCKVPSLTMRTLHNIYSQKFHTRQTGGYLVCRRLSTCLSVYADGGGHQLDCPISPKWTQAIAHRAVLAV